MPAPRGGRPERGKGRRSGDGLPPVRKSLGQHFLSDPAILARIAAGVAAESTDTVVEVGAGRGSLTEHLLAHAGRVVAVEYDRALAALLRERLASEARLEIVEADVLSAPLAAVAGTDDFLLVGNVPYYITTPIIFHALEQPRARRAVFLVQREVADRLAAAPNTEAYGALSVNVQAVARVERLFRVPAGAFHPAPKVDSAAVRIAPRVDPVVNPAEERPFRTLVQGAFSFRRKQMRRVVRSLLGVSQEEAEFFLQSAGLDPTARPETLAASDFAALLRVTHLRANHGS